MGGNHFVCVPKHLLYFVDAESGPSCVIITVLDIEYPHMLIHILLLIRQIKKVLAVHS